MLLHQKAIETLPLTLLLNPIATDCAVLTVLLCPATNELLPLATCVFTLLLICKSTAPVPLLFPPVAVLSGI